MSNYDWAKGGARAVGDCAALRLLQSSERERERMASSAVISSTVKALDLIGRLEHQDLKEPSQWCACPTNDLTYMHINAEGKLRLAPRLK